MGWRNILDFLIFLPLYRIEDFLGVLDPTSHLVLLRLQHVREGFVCLFSLFTCEQNRLLRGMQQYLAVVKEVDLKKFVAEAKHDSVSGFEPLLDVNELVVLLELELFLRHFFHFFIEMDHKPLQKQVFFLEVSIFGHTLGLVSQDALLLQCWIFHEVNSSTSNHTYCLF